MRITILACLLTGCALSPTSPDIDGDDGDAAPPPVASGSYQVASTIDITVEALLPQPAEDMVQTARDFSLHPGHTLIALADDAGVPAVGTLRDVLPSYLMGKIEGWIDSEIAGLEIAGVPVTQVAGDFAALAETSLTSVSLSSTLDVAGGTATHRLTALDVAGVTLRLGDLPGDVITSSAAATSSHGVLTVGDHRFALAYGEYAWRMLDQACTAQYGAGIRATLGTAVDCPAVAARVANKCVLGVCVGHASDLTEICEAGLDEVVERVHAQFSDLAFDALHFSAGQAKITATGLSDGVWTAEVNAGQGLRPAPATFSATR